MTAEPKIESPWGAPHPFLDRVLPPLSRAQVEAMLATPEGEADLAYYVERRELRLAEAERDPFQHGWQFAHWQEPLRWMDSRSQIYIPGGTGSAKTYFGGWAIARLLDSKPRLKVLAIAQNEVCSKAFQQAAVYYFLPVRYRNFNEGTGGRRRNAVTKINYSLSGGFTDMIFALPNRSICWFATVEQFLKNDSILEGRDFDVALVDEGAPLDLVEKLRFRVGKRGGHIFYLLTSVRGYCPVLAGALEGAKIVKTLPMQWDWLQERKNEEGGMKKSAEAPGEFLTGGINPALAFPEMGLDEVHVKGCPPGHMPWVMQPLNPAQIVVFFWTHWNCFLARSRRHPAWPALFDDCVGLPKWKARVRMFGWIERIAGVAIGNFDPAAHVVPHAKIEELLREHKLTTRMGCDPHTEKTSVFGWIGTAEDGTTYLIDESPCGGTEGEWVNADGAPGEGSTLFVHEGYNWTKKRLREREREHGVEPAARYGDPRAFATAAGTAAGVRNLFQLFAEDHSDEDPDFGPMVFQPAPIRQTVTLDIEIIIELFRYDAKRAEKEGGLTAENRPKLFVSDRCVNTIRSLLNWDGKPDSLYKDFIDWIRYAVAVMPYWIDDRQPAARGGRGWY